MEISHRFGPVACPDNPDEVEFYCVILNSGSAVQLLRAKYLAPVYFKETNFVRYCKLIPTSVLRKKPWKKKIMQVNPLPLPGLKNNPQREIVKISRNVLHFES